MSDNNFLFTLKKYKSVFVLIAVNLFPVIGVYLFGWDMFAVIMLYVIETFIVGFYNIFKMAFTNDPRKWFGIPFFIFHYNFFIAVQTVFIFIFFGVSEEFEMFETTSNIAIILQKDFLLSVLLIFISHGFSFYFNFYKKKLYQKKKFDYFMALPYRRIFIQQFVVIIGGFLIMAFRGPIVFIYLLVIFKTIIDLWTHLKMNKIREYNPVTAKNKEV